MLATLATAFVMLQHVGFLVLEMFLWQKPLGMRIFRTSPEYASATSALAANQGLYNGFLAAGLGWSLLTADPALEAALRLFFLTCVIVAGVFGTLTVSRSILFVQALPAGVALALHVVSR
jgi:putative membrane protein